MVDLIIVGAGGFGRELLQYARDAQERDSEIRIKGFLDDEPTRLDESGGDVGVGIVGDTYSYEVREHDRFLVSVGDPALRQTLAERLARRRARFFTLIHPTAYVAATARIGAGCIIGPFANIGSFAQIGEHVLVNLYAAAGHDTRIGAYSAFSPYAVANGGSSVGVKVFFGTHAVVTPSASVGDDCKIAAGAVVYKDVPVGSLASGNPAKAFPLTPASGDRS